MAWRHSGQALSRADRPAATTNVAYTLIVTDSASGSGMVHENPLGRSSPSITDTAASATMIEAAPAAALAEELERLHADTFGWALALCEGDRAEAEDVLQSAYLRVLSGKARFDGRSSVKTWLFGVVRHLRSERRRSVVLRLVARLRWLAPAREADPAAGPAEKLLRRELIARTRRALARLSARQRDTLHLVFYQELTIAEAAGILGITAGSARTHYERGKARLRKLLAEEAP
jgi:RNA polymerase sigma-70 factor (ECF subfamily)